MTSDATPTPPPPPGVRTTRRRGRTSDAKVAALRDLGPRWMVPASGPWDHESLGGRFPASGPLLVDVGVGDGAATRSWAIARPDAQVLAVEMHRPGIAKLLQDLDADGPANVRVVEADAEQVVAELSPASVQAIRVLFPDPWPKRRHVARRIVDRSFVESCADALEPSGHLFLSTDWADYAEHMATMVATDPRLAAAGDDVRPERELTTYERRGLRAGRSIANLSYVRSAST